MLSSGRERQIDAIDLRRRPDSSSFQGSRGVRRFYLVVLLLIAAATVGSIALQVVLTATAASLPVGRFEFTDGNGDTPGGWRVYDVEQAATALRDGDVITELNGIPSLTVLQSDSVRRALDRILRSGLPLSLTVSRQPTFARRPYWTLKVLGYSGSGGGTSVRSVVLDSVHAGLGLAATLRSFDPSDPSVCPTPPCPEDAAWLGRIPPGMALDQAESALVAYDPALRVLSEGTEVRLGLRGDDVARPVLSVNPPGGVAVQVERTPAGWTAIPAGTSVAELGLVRRSWARSGQVLSGLLIALLIVAVGLLSLQARTPSASVRYFAALCALLGSLSIVFFALSWNALLHPVSTHLVFGQQYIRFPTGDGSWSTRNVIQWQEMAILLLIGIGFTTLLYAALRLLQTFPSPDRDLEARYGVPWRAVPVVGILAAGGALWFPRAAMGRSSGWIFAGVLFLGFGIMLGLVAMLVQVARLALARWRQPRAGEEAMQARLALSGLVLGSTILLLIWVVPTGYVASHPWTVHLFDVVQELKGMVLPVALAIPFLGFFLAIAKKGLWDVDLIIQRATLYSALTGIFVLAWLALEAAVESFLSGSLRRIPVVGGLAPAILAAGVVAVSERSVSSLVSRRRRAAHVSLGDLVQRAADELGDVDDPDQLPARLVSRISQLLGSRCCALVLRDKHGPIWRAWRSEPDVPASTIAAAALGGFESSHHLVVLLDDGPCLVTRIVRAGEVAGVLILGARGDGAFYSPDEREMLSLFIAAMAPRLLT